jgi:hypothetical protein
MSTNKQIEALLILGDILDGTDEVREWNDIGFNKVDKHTWNLVRGDEQAMAIVLNKYRRQMERRGCTELLDQVDWDKVLPSKEEQKALRAAAVETGREKRRQEKEAKKRAEREAAEAHLGAGVQVTNENGQLGLRLNPARRAGGAAFQAFLQFVKGNGGRGDSSRGWLWTMPAGVAYDAAKQAMEAAGLTIDPLPEGFVAAKPEAKPTTNVVMKMREDGQIEIYHPYSEKMNAAYRSAEQTEGIIGFDWGKKCRLVGEECIEDLDDVVRALTLNHPEWTVGYDFDVEKWRQAIQAKRESLRQVTPDVVRHMRPGMAPLPFQVEGYRFYEMMNGNALNGDDMGLGKTLQTLLYAANHGKRAVVICPKNVRRQWLQEGEKFFVDGTFRGLEIDSSMTAQDVKVRMAGKNLVTVNYEIVGRYIEVLAASGFDLLVVDESHRTKNPDAQITQAVAALAAKFPHRIMLSGTAVKNKKSEIYTQAVAVRPGVFESQGQVSGMTFYQAKESIKKFFFRRSKKRELTLPPKIRGTVSVNVKCRDWEDGMQVGELSELKTDIAKATAPHTVEFVRGILDGSDSKVIVFSDSSQAAEIIAEQLGDVAVLHTGSTSHEKREQVKGLFTDENSSVRVFVATTGSAREGLNLTIADKVVFNDLPWTPADLNQAEDRAYRIGQNSMVNVYWMRPENNVFASQVVSLLFSKMAVYDKLINGKKPTESEDKLLKGSLTAQLEAALKNKKTA